MTNRETLTNSYILRNHKLLKVGIPKEYKTTDTIDDMSPAYKEKQYTLKYALKLQAKGVKHGSYGNLK